MSYVVSKERTSKDGKTTKSYYMGMIDIPMMGASLQTSPHLKDAKVFNSKGDAATVLPVMGGTAFIESIN